MWGSECLSENGAILATRNYVVEASEGNVSPETGTHFSSEVVAGGRNPQSQSPRHSMDE
jgi:hypothetical protein